ncbi:hypothetical protein GCK32_012096 [Trichostrongylus colubriformis]|uniref:Uncharacterized protein n=1 Tax=Trichostrongylus colubriformis TaxID=6319 RepID=A0AAN8ITV4_TRICO
MCLRKKKSRMSHKEVRKSEQGTTPKSHTPHTPMEKQAGKTRTKTTEEGENVMAKTCAEPRRLFEWDPQNPTIYNRLSIYPCCCVKARRVMKEVKEARDPAYKTLEPDMSDWESVRLMKKSEVNLDEIVKKDIKHLDATQN